MTPPFQLPLAPIQLLTVVVHYDREEGLVSKNLCRYASFVLFDGAGIAFGPYIPFGSSSITLMIPSSESACHAKLVVGWLDDSLVSISFTYTRYLLEAMGNSYVLRNRQDF